MKAMTTAVITAIALMVVCDSDPTGTSGAGDTTTATSITDRRNGKAYKTVKIDNQTWMAENLNYETATTNTDSSWCYGNSTDSCAKYGRLYTWDAAIKACPGGWHLPTILEWSILVDYASEYALSSTKLKSTAGWNDYRGESGNGTDEFGFSALPGGYRDYYDGFSGVGKYGYWWSATENEDTRSDYDAYAMRMRYDLDLAGRPSSVKNNGYSVRCVKD
ncbi:MAG: fibrobacter succinogenes major paralogous domain-containing protein [Chitinispirillales bacterium]|jgi:uncharacterized protein (TIGR02145 family)|nr:fibrobacter succinogenes major paralogous domain-containing protein [Chitinispirillales bacterium]